MLLAAMAVPAMAAPAIEREQPQVIRFVLPDAVPYEPPAPTADADPAFTPPSLATSGPAAPPFAAFLGVEDRVRAQQCLAMAVYYEAASESLEGQQAVAQVVINRVRHPAWPDSVCGVVFQGSERSTGCQFTFTCDGSLSRRPSAEGMARARAVARAALGGFVYKPVGLATHYHTTNIYPYWAPSLHAVATIGLHRFYRWAGAQGRPAAFTAVYDGTEGMPTYTRVSPARVEVTATYDRTGQTSGPTAPQPAAPEPIVLPPVAIEAAPAVLPQSGTVLEQHARSGQWIRQP